MRNSWHVSAKTLALGLALGCVASAFSQSKDSHLDRVVATKRLRVCIWPAYFGISYRNPKTQLCSAIWRDANAKHRHIATVCGDVADQLGITAVHKLQRGAQIFGQLLRQI